MNPFEKTQSSSYLEQTLVDAQIGLIHQVSYAPQTLYLFYSIANIANSSVGVGLDFDRHQARMASIGEAIERYCCRTSEVDQLIVGRYTDLATRFTILHPEDFPLFHPSQFAQIDYSPFTIETPISWTWAYSLSRGKPILVPASAIYLGYPRHEKEVEICNTTSNGAACGTSLSEAVIRGIYEIVERDALMLMWFNQHACPRVEFENNQVSGPIRKLCLQNNLTYTIIRMTNELPVHAMLAILVKEEPQGRCVSVGGSAHLDPQRAATKALIEAYQTYEWARHNKELIPAKASEIVSYDQHSLYYSIPGHAHELNFLINTPRSVRISELENYAQNTATVDLDTCLRLCQDIGIEVIVADLTRDDIWATGLRVVKVLMPKMVGLTLRHGQPFLGSPRIYEVPVRLGWRERAITPDGVNPAPHPFP